MLVGKTWYFNLRVILEHLETLQVVVILIHPILQLYNHALRYKDMDIAVGVCTYNHKMYTAMPPDKTPLYDVW